MAKKTNVSIEFEDLNPSDLSKVTDLIDTLGYAIVGYSITTPKVVLRSNPTPPTPRGKANEVGTPYAPKHAADEVKFDVEGVEAVPLDIQATAENISLEKPKNMGMSNEMKSNINKYL